MSVALASRTNSNISQSVKVRFQHLLVTKQLVTESVQTIQRNHDVSRRYPLLQLQAVLEIVSTRPTFQRRKGNVSELQRRNVRVFAGTERSRLVLALLDGKGVGKTVSTSAGGTVVLVRNPRAVLSHTLGNRKGFWTW